MWNTTIAIDAAQGPTATALKSDIVHRVDCKGCYAYYFDETWLALHNRMNIAEAGHLFDFENAADIGHGCFKGELLEEGALHSETQAVNRYVSLPVQDQAIQTWVNHKTER